LSDVSPQVLLQVSLQILLQVSLHILLRVFLHSLPLILPRCRRRRRVHNASGDAPLRRIPLV
jgi:hypothetical protein